MKKTKGIRKGDKPLVVKPMWWRQAALTLFLFVCGFFFAFIDYVGPITSWACTILFGILFLLSLLDQLVEWSRLKIDADGYDLRTWFKRQKFRHEEIDSFSSQTYLNRQLIILNLRKQSAAKLNLEESEVPFPCAFGHPVEDILKKLQKALDKTPRKKL
ncbi:MAG: hypothetical protein VX609_04605 [Verrucomicrobiota bacterium]|nr:hypothetical protein [Verrucomicrobiota bacterium]